ncbi:MAG TPA: DNA polymerase/3'-5' exonuclease PolX [Desulfobacterales bacterium]
MRIRNDEIAQKFDRLADFLEIEGANPFRVRAYRNAARTISGLARSVSELIEEGTQLTALPGIGKELAEKIQEVARTGNLAKLTEIEQRIPPGLHQVLSIPGLGPKKVKILYERLHVTNIEELRSAVEKKRIRELPGFGAKSEERILEELEHMARSAKRFAWIAAESIARDLTGHLKASGLIEQITVAGSFRRRKETVGDLDILVTCNDPAAVMNHFRGYEAVVQVISSGETRSSVVLHSGIQVDLRVVPAGSYGAALHYFTGSQAHNIAVRHLGRRKGLKINEYGVFRGEKRIAGATEEEVFAQVDLPYIEPELREDRGEIQAAREQRLPQLVTVDDIRGDLHCHTDDSDGRNTLEEMAAAAEARGYEYIAVTNHSQSLKIAGGLSPKAVRKLINRIDALNAKQNRLVVLKSMEIDILRDGRLDMPDDLLAELDFVICSVHTDFRLPRDQQTERILRAMDNPYFTILGHPSGRLINRRKAYDVDLVRIIETAAQRGCHLELNAHPDRLDLDDIHCRHAKEAGVKAAISTDAHGIDHFDHMRLGVAQARRGWLEAADVLNTRSLADLRQLLKRE